MSFSESDSARPRNLIRWDWPLLISILFSVVIGWMFILIAYILTLEASPVLSIQMVVGCSGGAVATPINVAFFAIYSRSGSIVKTMVVLIVFSATIAFSTWLAASIGLSVLKASQFLFVFGSVMLLTAMIVLWSGRMVWNLRLVDKSLHGELAPVVPEHFAPLLFIVAMTIIALLVSLASTTLGDVNGDPGLVLCMGFTTLLVGVLSTAVQSGSMWILLGIENSLWAMSIFLISLLTLTGAALFAVGCISFLCGAPMRGADIVLFAIVSFIFGFAIVTGFPLFVLHFYGLRIVADRIL